VTIDNVQDVFFQHSVDNAHINRIYKNMQIQKLIKNITTIKYLIISGRKNENWIKFGTGFCS